MAHLTFPEWRQPRLLLGNMQRDYTLVTNDSGRLRNRVLHNLLFFESIYSLFLIIWALITFSYFYTVVDLALGMVLWTTLTFVTAKRDMWIPAVRARIERDGYQKYAIGGAVILVLALMYRDKLGLWIKAVITTLILPAIIILAHASVRRRTTPDKIYVGKFYAGTKRTPLWVLLRPLLAGVALDTENAPGFPGRETAKLLK